MLNIQIKTEFNRFLFKLYKVVTWTNCDLVLKPPTTDELTQTECCRLARSLSHTHTRTHTHTNTHAHTKIGLYLPLVLFSEGKWSYSLHFPVICLSLPDMMNTALNSTHEVLLSEQGVCVCVCVQLTPSQQRNKEVCCVVHRQKQQKWSKVCN